MILLIIALAATLADGQPHMHAHAYPTMRECEAVRLQMPPSDTVRWTRCVGVVAR